MKIISLDSFGSWESTDVYFKTLSLLKHELNHFEGDPSTIISLFRSLTSDHEKARETKIHMLSAMGAKNDLT